MVTAWNTVGSENGRLRKRPDSEMNKNCVQSDSVNRQRKNVGTQFLFLKCMPVCRVQTGYTKFVTKTVGQFCINFVAFILFSGGP